MTGTHSTTVLQTQVFFCCRWVSRRSPQPGPAPKSLFLLNYSFVCLFVCLFISFFFLPIRSLTNANTNSAWICFPRHSQVSVEDKLHVERDRRRALPEEALEMEKTLMSLSASLFLLFESSSFSWVQLIKVVFQGLLKLLGETQWWNYLMGDINLHCS